MAKTNTLTIQQIKELSAAKSELDAAKIKFDMLKEEYCPESLPAGKYFAENEGVVMKSATVRGTVNYKQLLEEHPEIDVEKYTEYKEVVSVIVKPLKDTSSILKKILH